MYHQCLYLPIRQHGDASLTAVTAVNYTSLPPSVRKGQISVWALVKDSDNSLVVTNTPFHVQYDAIRREPRIELQYCLYFAENKI